MNRFIHLMIMLTLATALSLSWAEARDRIQIAGSSTVLPYAKIVAETFGETYPDFKTPVVESGGSGAGIKEFCKGIGESTIDIANASRAMKESELKSCMNADVKDIEEVRIGYDGIVFATDIHGPTWKLTPRDIFLALAAKISVDGKLTNNPNTKWNEINPNLPKWDIVAYIPGEKHGTRDVFEEKILLSGCKEAGVADLFKASGMDDNTADKNCVIVRKDGKAVDVDGDYSETLARMTSNKTGIGVFGFSFYENNADKLKVAAIDNIVPSRETIIKGEYPISRPLFFYVKKAHLGIIPGLKEYVEFFLSDQMIGPDSPLAEYGLVPASDSEREAQRAAFTAGKTMIIQ